MKTTRLYFKTAFIAGLLFLLNSCLDYDITTRINEDGSLDRIIKVTRNDSGSFTKGSFYIPSDSSWNISTAWEYLKSEKGDSARKYVMIARKHYKNINEMNPDLLPDSGEIHFIKTNAKLDKHFRLFYTYLKYTETYKQYFPFRHFPVDDFLSETEIEFLFNDTNFIYSPAKDSFIRKNEFIEIPVLSKKDSINADKLKNEINKKFSRWEATNAFKEFSHIITEGMKKNHPDIEELLTVHNDSLFAVIMSVFDIGFGKRLETSIISTTAAILNIDRDTLYDSNKAKFDTFLYKTENLYKPAEDEFINRIIMPGTIVAANSENTEGNQLSWKPELADFYAKDYVMYAESRFINKWTIVGGIILVVILSIGFAVGFSIKKKGF